MAVHFSSLRILIGTAALLGALALPVAASAKANLQVGFLDNSYAAGYPDQFWSDAVALRVGFMRWDLQWNAIAASKPLQPRNPADPAYDFAHADQFIQAAAAHGISDRIMVTLWRTPRWASSLGGGRGYETHMPKVKAWRDFVYACAKRYSGTYTPPGATQPLPRIRAWETWNEPNAYFAFRPQFQNGIPVSPRNYTVLLSVLRKEVMSAVPFKPTFVAGAMYKQGGPKSLTPIRFMEGMAAAGARFDVLSMHPYNRNPHLGIRDGINESKTNPYFIGIGNFETFIARSNVIFGRKYPIWITEFGLQTHAKGATRTTSFPLQARFVRQSIAKLKRLPQVERAAWFLLKDEPPRIGNWYTTGLRKSDLAKKPSYGAWRQATVKLQRSPIR
jgi:hypothetical protein